MYNRKERRRIEKELGIAKLLKHAPKDVKDILLQKRKEENLAMQQAWKEEQESIANEREVQRYAKQLQFYMEEMDLTQKEAEETIQKQRLIEEERALRKKNKK